MAWSIRSLADASARVRGAFRQYMPGTDSSLANNFVTVVVKVLAALAHEFELRMAWLAQQIFLSTATGQFLATHCYEIGIYRRPAARAGGLVAGTATALVTVPSGIRFISGNMTYVSVSPATSGGDGSIVLDVIAETAGAVGNRGSGGILALADILLFPDLGSEWTVDAGGLGGGADIETDESLRARGLQRKQNPPGGGTLTDYERIVLAVPGVLRAWAFRDPLSPGFIVVLFLFVGRANLLPLPSDVVAVQDAIDLQRLIRVDDSVAAAPVARVIDIAITGLSADTPEIRAQIPLAVTAMFLEKCRPGIDGDTFTVSASWISEAISGVAGESRHVLVSPSVDIVLTGGQFPVVGEVTFGS